MAMPSASPTKIKARPAISGLSLIAPIVEEPTSPTAIAAPIVDSHVATAAAMNAHCMAFGFFASLTIGSVELWAFVRRNRLNKSKLKKINKYMESDKSFEFNFFAFIMD
jgi:hypothetical protein